MTAANVTTSTNTGKQVHGVAARLSRRSVVALGCRLSVAAVLGGLSTGRAYGLVGLVGQGLDNQDSYTQRRSAAAGGEWGSE
jgi:hypothetical protein